MVYNVHKKRAERRLQYCTVLVRYRHTRYIINYYLLFLCQSGDFSVASNDFSVLSNDFPATSESARSGWVGGGWMDGPIINKRYHIFLKADHSQSRAEKAIQRLDELHLPKLIVLVVLVCNDCFNEVVC